MWFNHCIDESSGTWLQEKPSDALLGGQLLATQSLVLMDDMKALNHVPSIISAAAIGLCAIDRNYDAAIECLSRIHVGETRVDRHVLFSLLHCYTRTQRREELIQLARHALKNRLLPRKMIQQSILLDADCHPEFCRTVYKEL
jgi:lipopolysaccharide biosynthesis regulator YciM